MTACSAWHGAICSDCAIRCEREAIRYEGLWMPHILAEVCGGCGACVSGCRLNALSTEEIEKGL